MKVYKNFIKVGAFIMLWVAMCFFTVSCQKEGPRGDVGPKGDTGNTGKSAYELAVENGYKGTVNEWLTSLSVKGDSGAEGKSSYQIAKENGFSGTEQEWLASLVGAQGTKGDKGEVGKDGETPYIKGGTWWIGTTDTGVSANGNKGETGDKGDKGDKGDTGLDGKNVVFRVNDDWLQWKYDTDTSWINLYEINGTPPSEGLVKLSYVLDGGAMPSGVPSEIEVTAGTVIQLPTPSYRGYTFMGWYKQGGEYPVSNEYRVHQSEKLYAHWEAGAIITGKKIYTIDDLASINNNLGGTYVLMNDIDCHGLAIPIIGNSQTNSFRGVFDGQGFTISNYVASTGEYVGLFGYNTGIIRNLKVKDFNFTVSNAASATSFYAGGIVAYNAGTISCCGTENGNIDIGLDIERRAGLVTAYNTGIIKDCYATGSAKAYQINDNRCISSAAGISGHNYGKIKNCYVNVYLYAHGNNWGPAGEAAGISTYNSKNSSIENCLVFGAIQCGVTETEGKKYLGDICGQSDGAITNCYKDELLSLHSPTHTYATAMTRKNLNNASFYKITLGWDLDIWSFDHVDLENNIFPTLKIFD